MLPTQVRGTGQASASSPRCDRHEQHSVAIIGSVADVSGGWGGGGTQLVVTRNAEVKLGAAQQ
jgi:hypothetical protein